MSATLFRGIKQLYLMLTPPYDTTDPGVEPRIRDDLSGVKVWISTTAGFTPDPATAIDFAANSSIILSNLATNTRYYVRYAFISKIEPSIYTVSSQLTAKTYDELTTVYGELTNDPAYLERSEDGLDWTGATGIFRVWEYNLEVTGNGVQYGVVADSATNGLVADINATTGVFTATGWTTGTRNARITFYATYNGVTVTRDWNVVDSVGQDAPQITLNTSPDVFIYQNNTAELADTLKIISTATITNLVGNATFTVRAYKADGTQITTPAVQFTQVTGNPNAIQITREQFHISNDIGYITIEARIGDIYDLDTVFRLNNGTNEITIDLDNPVVQLQATELGEVDPAEYAESGTKITVYEGATKLAVSTSGSVPSTWLPGTWNITTIEGFGIVPDDTWTTQNNSIVFGSHSTMTTDTAYIEYTVSYKTKAGFVDSRVVKQKFAKSKQGFAGISAPLVTIKGAQAFVRPANEPDTATAPAYIDLIAATSNITNPQFQWRVDGVLQTGETESDFRVNKFTNTEYKTIRVDVTGLNTQGESISQYDEHTVYFVDSGDSAIVAFCTPEFTGISCDSQGDPETTQFPFYINTTVLRGGEILTNTSAPGTITYALEYLSGILPGDISINQTTGIITLADIQNTYSSFNVKFTIGSTVINKTVRLNKILAGDSAPVVNVTATNQIFVKAKNTGALSPSATTITASPVNVPNPSYSWTIDNIAQPSYTGSTISVDAFEGNPKLVKCTVTSGTVADIQVYDTLTLYSVKEGDDAIVFGITNENQTLSCDNSGTPVAGQYPITTELVVLQGSTRLTPPAVSYSIVSQTGTDSTKVSITGSILTIASGGITADFAEVQLRATVGSLQLTKVLSISKSKEGAQGVGGSNGKTVSLSLAEPGHVYDTNGNNPSPLTQTITATTYNVTASTVYYQFFVDGVSVQNTTSNNYLYTARSSYISMPDLITVKVREGSSTGTVIAEDSTTVVGIKAGSDSVVVWVENPAHTLSTTKDGVVTYTNSGTAIMAAEGSTILDASATLATNSTFKVSAVGTNITPNDSPVYSGKTVTYGQHSAITQDSARITYTVTVKTSTGTTRTFTVYQNFAKSKEGQTGAQTTTVYLYARNSSTTAPTFSPPVGLTYDFTTGALSASITNWQQSIPSAASGTTVWVRQAVATSAAGGTVSTNTLTWSSAVVLAADGASGDSIDIVFKRSATQPSTPAPSTGVPSTWYTDVNSVPASSDPLWSTVGTKLGTSTTYTWDTPIRVEGSDGAAGLSVAELTIYKRSATTLTTTPTGGSYNFSTRTLTVPSDGGAAWSSTFPSGTDPVYISRAVASIQGITGTTSSLTWSAPVLAVKNGDTGPTGPTGPTGSAGLAGIVQRIAYQLVTQSAGAPSYTASTSGSSSLPGASWSSTVPTATVGNVVWYIYGQYNPNAVSYQGIAADTTVWSAPIAASVFQDIRSDNWNGSNPPTAGNFGGATSGYYLNKSEGSIYVQQGYVKGTLVAGSIISDSATLNTIGGTALSTIASNASAAYAGLSAKLDKLGTYILGTTTASNEITLKTSGYDAGTGIIITNTGILGKQSGTTTFAIDNAGNATFKGDISGSTGTFAGTLTVGSGNTVFKVNSDGSIHSGNTSFASAPFKVTNTGTLTATNATITGTLVAGSVISDAVTLSSGTSLATVASNASAAYAGLSTKLDKLGTYILGTTTASNEISLKTSGYDAGTGIIITNTGILGKQSGTTTFAIDNAGNATFKGDISGSTGTFAGQLVVGGIAYSTSAFLNSNTTSTDVGLGNVSNLTPQNQAQTGLISGVTITGGGITMSSGGSIKGGQTDYNTGTGWFIGYSGGGYKLSIGSSSQSLTWSGSALTITGNITGNGTALFTGSNNEGGLLNTAVKVNTGAAADIGIAGYAGSSGLGRGVIGYANYAGSAGVVGTVSSASGTAGVIAVSTAGGTVPALWVQGTMKIDSSAFVANLNAQFLNGLDSGRFVQIPAGSGISTGQYMYYVNNNTAPADPVNRAAWIRLATNDGGYVYFPGYL